jgi:hypothetical protein
MSKLERGSRVVPVRIRIEIEEMEEKS